MAKKTTRASTEMRHASVFSSQTLHLGSLWASLPWAPKPPCPALWVASIVKKIEQSEGAAGRGRSQTNFLSPPHAEQHYRLQSKAELVRMKLKLKSQLGLTDRQLRHQTNEGLGHTQRLKLLAQSPPYTSIDCRQHA